MVDIVAISPASVTAINRNVYVELKRRGWKLEMVIPLTYAVSKTKIISSEPARKQDPVIHFLELKRKNPRMFYFPQLNQMLMGSQPRIIILENDPVSFIAMQLGKFCNKHGIYLFCLSCENLPFDLNSSMRRRGVSSLPSAIIKSYLYRAGRKNIDTVFTISNDGTKLFEERAYKRVIKIPLGFDRSIFYEDIEKGNLVKSRLGLNYPVFAYFGRMVQEKGVHLLVEALSGMKHLNWHLMLDTFDRYANPYGNYIDELIHAAGLGDKLIYIHASHYEMPSYMNAADVVIMPSISTPTWKEQYGRVAPEVMACGKLVVASKSGTLPELIGDGGVLFNEGDVSGLTSILKEYLEHPSRYKEIKQRGKLHAESSLSINNQAAAYEHRIKEVLID